MKGLSYRDIWTVRLERAFSKSTIRGLQPEWWHKLIDTSPHILRTNKLHQDRWLELPDIALRLICKFAGEDGNILGHVCSTWFERRNLLMDWAGGPPTEELFCYKKIRFARMYERNWYRGRKWSGRKTLVRPTHVTGFPKRAKNGAICIPPKIMIPEFNVAMGRIDHPRNAIAHLPVIKRLVPYTVKVWPPHKRGEWKTLCNWSHHKKR